jgi:hypothetical protein
MFAILISAGAQPVGWALDFLRWDLHRDRAQRDPQHLQDRNKNEREARPAHTLVIRCESGSALVSPSRLYAAAELCNGHGLWRYE